MNDKNLRESLNFLKKHGFTSIITTLVLNDLVFNFEFGFNKPLQCLNIIFLFHHHIRQ